MASDVSTPKGPEELLRLAPVEVEGEDDGRLFVRSLIEEHAADFVESITTDGHTRGPGARPAGRLKESVRAGGEDDGGAPGAHSCGDLLGARAPTGGGSRTR
eukprot:10962373-Lingulodinium_polyedra.AAC.1